MEAETTAFGEVWRDALTKHQQGAAREAELLYRRLIEMSPENPDVLTNLAGLLAETGREQEAGALLDAALAADPSHARAHAQRDRLHFLARRASDPVTGAEIERMHATLEAMNRELSRKAIYVPGTFWEHFGKLHVYLLERYGVENFKRTVAHNYQNWFMTNRENHQVQRLFDLWSTHLSSQPLRNGGELPSDVGYHNPPIFPFYALADPAAFEIYRLSVGLLWEYTLAGDETGILENASESPIGNPVRISRNGRLMSSDLCHSVRERNEILKQSGLHGNEALVVGELGAGNGRLAEIFGRTTNYRYLIFDITPALYVSQWYVKNLFPAERVFEFRPFDSYAEIEKELAASRFAFFTANQIELLPPNMVDVFININSLMEMTGEQISNFLVQIDRLTKGWLYLQQWFWWKNTLDDVEVTKDTFHPKGAWELAYESANEVYPDFFVQLWKKAG